MSLSRVAQSSDALGAELIHLSADGIAPGHLALLLEIAAEGAESRTNAAMAADVVWTGPEAPVSHTRDTSVVVEELFANAQHDVLVSSFVVHQGALIFKPLATRMAQLPELRVRLFLHVDREWKDTRDDSELLRAFGARFAQQWPWPQRPEVYYDPRTVALDGLERVAWHAKCILVDEDLAFVTSANFTEWAQQRNTEAGVLLRNHHFASRLRRQFEFPLESKQVRRIPGY